MRGLLVVNLGTPDAPEASAVRRYLEEFLLDPRVIDLPWIARQALVRGVILRTRPKRSAEAYRKVWDPERGSPLLFHSQDLADSVAAALGEGWKVVLAMRYGNPSIADGLAALADADDVVVIPLFPQYATATTESVRDAVARLAPPGLSWRFVDAFPTARGFVDAVVDRARSLVDGADHILMSFHGIPERQLIAADPRGNTCLTSGCCDSDPIPRCYRAHCVATARAVAAGLGLREDRWSVSFQSRLGRMTWLGPYTDHVVEELPTKGVGRLVVLTPSFVTDCLETLEEIGMGERERFLAAGGEHFAVAPCPNAHPRMAQALAELARHA